MSSNDDLACFSNAFALRRVEGQTLLTHRDRRPATSRHTVMGALLVYLIVSILNAQFEHTNVRLNERLDRFLRVIVVTPPNMHKVHHSPDQIETDSNCAKCLLDVGSRVRHLHSDGGF